CDLEAHRRLPVRRIPMSRNRVGLSMIACLVLTAVALTTTGVTAQQVSGGSNGFVTPVGAGEPPSVSGQEVARLPVGDGYFVFVLMLKGEVGIVAEGQRAVELL